MSLNSDLLNSGIAGRLPKRIVIAGGGLSGWMAAALLQQFAGGSGCRITLVDVPVADEYPPAGATLPSVIGLLQNLGVEENEALRHCRGTYRLAAQFADWVRPERDFWLPLGSDRLRSDRRELFHSWFAERNRGRLLRPLHSYSLHWGASLAGKSPHAFSGKSPISDASTYALHLDTTAFSNWLQTIAVQSGVEVYSGAIAAASPNGRGGIAQIRLNSGQMLPGDLFIDCTGTSSQLAQQFLHDPCISWKSRLPCDRCLSVRFQGSRQIPSYTKITGLPAGWMYQIPLAGDLEFGYVYCSDFAADDDARKQLQAALPRSLHMQLPKTDYVQQPIHSGRRTQFWRDNVLALGASAASCEPLAASSVHLTQTGLELFLELFPDRGGSPACQSYYNERMGRIVDQFADFIQLHYLLSQRRDTPFWTHIAMLPPSEQLQQRLDVYDISGTLDGFAAEAPQASDYYHLLAGCGRLPRNPSVISQAADPAEVQQRLRQIIQQNDQALRDLPLHEELLDWVHLTPTAGQAVTAGQEMR